MFDPFFVPILRGYLRHAHATSPTYAVCDFPDGTRLPGCMTPKQKTYVSVSRMMPALAAYAKGRNSAQVTEALRLAFKNAFDPNCPDYWGEPPADQQHQKQVEASVVAWALWVARDELLPALTAQERSRVNAWLASCTRRPVRSNNWAWFTAVNQAVRLSLSERWSEFSGDPKWMEEDLAFLDTLATPGDDGWYTDALKEPVYDYYNFWVFASHFLYWNRVAGARYPEWRRRFATRLKPFLEKSPYFFGANGAHILYGRSLIYRWAVLTPLVLAYEQGLWPHSPGLLRRIVRKSLDYHQAIGAFDGERGKLREAYSEFGTPDIHETYIDNGHPYWCMQAFATYLIPAKDPFWRAREEALPVERGDFHVRFDGPKMALSGAQRTGQVRWIQAATHRNGLDYRDKYDKLVYSSAFPFSIVKGQRQVPADAAALFVNTQTGAFACRAGIASGELTDRGSRVAWWAVFDGMRFDVVTGMAFDGDGETRRHEITLPPAAAGRGIEFVEGSYAWALPGPDRVQAVALSGQRVERLEQIDANLVAHRTALFTMSKLLAGDRVTLESRWSAR